MSAKFNISIDQGTDVKIELTFKDSAGVAINLTGYTFASQARVKLSDAAPAFAFAFVVINAVTGRINMTLAKAITSALSIRGDGKYLYDVEGTIDGATLRYFEGVVTVTPEVTK